MQRREYLIGFFIFLFSFFTSLDVFGFGLLFWIYLKKKENFFLEKIQGMSFFFYIIPIFLLVAHVFKHVSFNTHAYDVSFVNQALFHPFLDGKWLKSDLSINGSYLGEHLSFTLIIFGQLLQLFQSDYLVIVIQNLIMTFSIVWIIKKGPSGELKKMYVYLFVLIFCSRSLRGAYLFDFREDSIAFCSLLFMLWSIYARKTGILIISLLMVLLSKENYSLISMVIPFAILLDKNLNLSKREKVRYSTIIWGISFSYLLISFRLLIPQFTQAAESSHPIVFRFREFGSSPYEILVNVLTTPKYLKILISEYLMGWDRLKYIVYLMAPFVLVGIRGWVWFIPALPGIFFNLVAPNYAHRSMSFHYDLMTLPFLIFAVCVGIKKITNARLMAFSLGLAIAFSSKWPTNKMTTFMPSLSDIRNSIYLSDLDETKITAAGMGTLSHLSYINSLRGLENIPNTEDRISGYLKSVSPKSRKKLYDASRWVIDNNTFNETLIASALMKRGAREISRSPDGRFSYLGTDSI